MTTIDRSNTRTGTSFLVSVLGQGGCERHERPDVIVEIGRRNGR
jgi:hypothetical protein